MSKLKDQVVEIINVKTLVTTEGNHTLTKKEIKQLEKITQEIIKKIEKDKNQKGYK